MATKRPWGVEEMRSRCKAGCKICEMEMGHVLEASLKRVRWLERVSAAEPLTVFVPVPPPKVKVPLRQVRPGVFVAQCYYCDGSTDVQYLRDVPLCAYCREGKG